MNRYVLTLHCADQPGINKALADGIVAGQGNITDNQQFSDTLTGEFTLRTEFDSALDIEGVQAAVIPELAKFDPIVQLRDLSKNRRMMILVSKFDHCLRDLIYRHQIGEIAVDIPIIVSNHEDLRDLVESNGYRFEYIPVTPDSKAQAEAQLLALVEELDIDFVVLARYMQVLSDGLCRELEGRAINIHHSFLPGFKGAKPYHQAHARGVKLIGATAHYVTAALDEGPIIEQDVVRIGHAFTPEQMVALGRDVERLVLSRAVRQHAEDRVMLVGHRTVIFA